MTVEFGLKQKQVLAGLMGGHIPDGYSIAVARGRDQIVMEPYGYMEGERRLGFSIRCRLDRAEEHGAGAGDGQDFRQRVDGLPELLLRRETAEDRKGKWWGLNREVRTSDSDFDELVYVESAAPDEHIRAVLGLPETRRIVMTLFEHHCESISINKQAGELVVKFRAHEPTEESLLPRLAQELEWVTAQALSLRASLPLFVGDAKPARRYPLLKWAYRIEALLLVSGLVSGAVVSGFEMDPVDDRPVLFLLGIGFGSAVAFVPLAWLIARGHSRGAGHFLGLLILGLFAFPPGALGLGIGTNCLLDTSPPQEQHVLTVADPEYCSHDKHWVAVQDWRDRRRTFNVALHNLRLCDATKRGDTFVLITREGFWGWPWIQDFHVLR